MSQPPSISKTTQSAATRDETGAATAMKRDILHSVDAAGFLESAPDAMVIVDEQGRIVAVNTLAEKLFGYRREELIGELVEMLVTDRSRNRHVDLRRRYIADPLPWTVGADLGLYGLRKDGKELSIEISLSPLVTPAGRLVLSAIRDFTDIERMKEQLRQGAEELQKVMDVAPVALLVSHDRECHEITGNRAGNAMFEGKEGTNLSLTPADGSVPNRRYLPRRCGGSPQRTARAACGCHWNRSSGLGSRSDHAERRQEGHLGPRQSAARCQRRGSRRGCRLRGRYRDQAAHRGRPS